MGRMVLQQTGRNGGGCSRREFLGGAVGTAAAAPFVAAVASLVDQKPAQAAQPAAAPSAGPVAPKRKIKLGLIGCGGRGTWITKLFLQHGGYQFHAVADYFQANADKLADKLNVAASRRFSGLSGYKKLIDSGVEAIACIVPPGFAPEHTSAAVEAGLHVYVAKPVAPDVPGCLRILAAGTRASEKNLAFLVDYQMPTDPNNQHVAEGVRAGAIGKISKVFTLGISGGHKDPPKTANIESRLQDSIWNYDIALSGGWSVSYDIHAIDAAIWLLGQRPTAAMGLSRITRDNPHGDACDVSSFLFEYANGVIHEHTGVALPTGEEGELTCRVHGQVGWALIPYIHKARLQPRGKKPFAEPVNGGYEEGLYAAGAARNIAAFYQSISTGQIENATVRRAVDGCLTCILGREAAARRGRLTMDELLRENKPYEIDLSGLKV